MRVRGGHGIDIAQCRLVKERSVVLISLVSARREEGKISVGKIGRDIIMLRLGVQRRGGVGTGSLRLLSEACAGVKAGGRVDSVGLGAEKAVGVE